MPSYKPKVQVLLTQNYHDKFKELCDRERRSDSVMGAIMIEKYIDNYEKENGEIILKSSKEILKEQMELIKKPEKGILKKSLKAQTVLHGLRATSENAAWNRGIPAW